MIIFNDIIFVSIESYCQFNLKPILVHGFEFIGWLANSVHSVFDVDVLVKETKGESKNQLIFSFCDKE